MLGQQYDSMDCKPYSTAKYYKAYRPDVPGLVPVCLRAAVDTKDKKLKQRNMRSLLKA